MAERCDVVIVTAADGEDAAVRDVAEGRIGDWRESPKIDRLPNIVWEAEFQGTNGAPLRFVLAQSLGQGGDPSMALAQRLVSHFNPSCLAMCGVCAGRPKDTKLGDVIIADSVWRYDFGKSKRNTDTGEVEFFTETLTYRIPADWLQRAQAFPRPSSDSWPKGKRFARWKIHVGPIATGSAVIEDPEVWGRLKSIQRKTIGLEMEAAAIGLLGWLNSGHDEKALSTLIVKGVMDHAAPGRDDAARPFAARAAAEVLIGFLRARLKPVINTASTIPVLEPNAAVLQHPSPTPSDDHPAELVAYVQQRIARTIEALDESKLRNLADVLGFSLPVNEPKAVLTRQLITAAADNVEVV